MARALILVADDHAIVQRGLRALLQSHSEWEVCAEVANGREAVEKVAQFKPDVAIIDIGVPELNGLDATRSNRQNKSSHRSPDPDHTSV